MRSRAFCFLMGIVGLAAPADISYPLVDTGQIHCFDLNGAGAFPGVGEPFAGQDAPYAGNQPDYEDNGNGTVSDRVTGLMWTQDPGEKMTFAEAVAGASRCRVGSHEDWRLPSIKELYSLIQHKLASKQTETEATLAALLDARLQAVGAHIPTTRSDYDPEARPRSRPRRS